MREKNLIIFVFLFLFSLTFISSAPPQTIIQNFPEGLVIENSPQKYLVQGEDYTVNFFIYNSTSGLQVDNSSINCSFYIDNYKGELVVYGDTEYNENDYWDFLILGGNFSDAGLYQYGIQCQGTNVGGVTVGSWEVNSIGKELSIAQSILYGFFLTILVLIFIINFIGMSLLPSKNQRDEEGKILSINYLKYGRNILWMTGYFLFIAIVFVASNLAYAFLNEELIADILFMIFRISFGLAPVILIVWLIWIFVSMFHDKQFQQMLNRGMFPQGKI